MPGALEIGAEVWVPCEEEVWRPGVVMAFEDEPPASAAPGAAKSPVLGSPVKPKAAMAKLPLQALAQTSQVPEGHVVVEVQKMGNSKGSGKGFLRAGSSVPTYEEVRVQRPVPGAKSLLYLRNEVLKHSAGALALHDLAHLPLLHEPAILHALQLRFRSDYIYTLTGPMLLAVNPFKALTELYGSKRLHAFIQQISGKGDAGEKAAKSIDVDGTQAATEKAEQAEEPHIYGVAKAAYDGVWHRVLGQTVLVSGESGAGKTETTKFVMRFLALAGAGGTEASMSTIERQVLDSIPVLEALGNAKTLRNENSSRFGKYIELQFRPPDAHGEASHSEPPAPRLVGAHTHTYLLEKVRVVGQQQKERSFHIFYQILAAASKERPGSTAIAGLQVDSATSGLGPGAFSYLCCSGCTSLDSGLDEAAAFQQTVTAMRAFGLQDPELSGICCILLAVLYLGNLGFSPPKTNSEASEVSESSESSDGLAKACELLGVAPEVLADACCKRTMQAPGEGVITMPNSTEKAADSRDSLARHLYGALFAYVVGRINATVSETGGAAWSKAAKLLPFVGVLDIFGFEFFDMNSLEQLFINFTNELLQQYFNEVIFEHEASLYRREGIRWDPLDFPDNHAIVDMIGGKQPLGILPMLDEECITTGGNSDQWCSKLCRAHGANSHFGVVKLRQSNFVVHHFAGPVEYMSKNFVEKNRDALGANLVKCMQGSSRDFVQKLFREHGRTFGTKESIDASTGARRMSKAKLYTVSSEFRGQLQNLMERIRSTEPHFVRCIKPNPESAAGHFDRKFVVQQLQYQGVLQAIEVSRVGFPVRLKHRQAVTEFRCLTNERLQVEAFAARGQLASAARLLFESLSEGFMPSPRATTPFSARGSTPRTPRVLCSPRTPRRVLGPQVLSSATWAVGKTLVFLKREAVEALSHALSRCRRAAATQIQAAVRRWEMRSRFLAVAQAARKLQTVGRGLLARKRASALRKSRAAVRIQSWWRRRKARQQAARLKHAIALIQSWSRARRLRVRLLQTFSAVRLLQRNWRRTMVTVRAKRQRESAATIQRVWRGHRGRREVTETKVAQLRRRRAARTVLDCWREKVSRRLFEDGLDEFLGQADERAIQLKIHSRLEAASEGQLEAALHTLRQAYRLAAREANRLRQEQEALRNEAAELSRWTFFGLLGRMLSGVAQRVCPRPARLGSSIELGQPLLHDDVD